MQGLIIFFITTGPDAAGTSCGKIMLSRQLPDVKRLEREVIAVGIGKLAVKGANSAAEAVLVPRGGEGGC